MSTAPGYGARREQLVRRLYDLVPGVARADVRVVRAPGRINLVGEHTDYNLGFVLPAAISLETWIAAAPATDGRVELTSLQAGETRSFELSEPGPPTGGWIDYAAGVAIALRRHGVRLRAVRGVIDSTIPIGSGLSSSAALELAVAMTLAEEVPPPLDRMALAKAAQAAENEYVGVQCGLMDQFASAFGASGQALLLDCRSLAHRTVPLPLAHTLVALDTRASHDLSGSLYNARREQCERAVRILAAQYPDVRSLRDATPQMLNWLATRVDEETLRRCRHVVAENERVLKTVEALETGDMHAVGRLFAESHASLRDLYEVSTAGLDALVEIAVGVPGVVAARMTGAGFGGCTVNIVATEAVDALRDAVDSQYPQRTGRGAGFHVLAPVAGASLVEA